MIHKQELSLQQKRGTLFGGDYTSESELDSIAASRIIFRPKFGSISKISRDIDNERNSFIETINKDSNFKSKLIGKGSILSQRSQNQFSKIFRDDESQFDDCSEKINEVRKLSEVDFEILSNADDIDQELGQINSNNTIDEKHRNSRYQSYKKNDIQNDTMNQNCKNLVKNNEHLLPFSMSIPDHDNEIKSDKQKSFLKAVSKLQNINYQDEIFEKNIPSDNNVAYLNYNNSGNPRNKIDKIIEVEFNSVPQTNTKIEIQENEDIHDKKISNLENKSSLNNNPIVFHRNKIENLTRNNSKIFGDQQIKRNIQFNQIKNNVNEFNRVKSSSSRNSSRTKKMNNKSTNSIFKNELDQSNNYDDSSFENTPRQLEQRAFHLNNREKNKDDMKSMKIETDRTFQQIPSIPLNDQNNCSSTLLTNHGGNVSNINCKDDEQFYNLSYEKGEMDFTDPKLPDQIDEEIRQNIQYSPRINIIKCDPDQDNKLISELNDQKDKNNNLKSSIKLKPKNKNYSIPDNYFEMIKSQCIKNPLSMNNSSESYNKSKHDIDKIKAFDSTFDKKIVEDIIIDKSTVKESQYEYSKEQKPKYSESKVHNNQYQNNKFDNLKLNSRIRNLAERFNLIDKL